MRAAVLFEHGGIPRAHEFDEPHATERELVVAVRAAGLHHLDLLKASGTFYVAPPELPYVVGTDGVGVLPDGRRVFFDATAGRFGSMAERALVPAEGLLDVADGVDDDVAAALGNTGLGAYLALAWRSGLQPGETVLVLGATGAVGTVAVQVAKHLGAGRVVAAAPGEPRLDALRERGADATVALDEADDLAGAFRDAAGGDVDVTIDTLWGAPAVAAMQAAARWARHIQIGHLAGAEIALPAPLVRSRSLDLRGFNVSHPPLEVRRVGYLRLTELAARGELVVDVERVALDDVASAWQRQRRAAGGPKLVVIPEPTGAGGS